MGTKSIFTIIDGDHTFRVYMSDDYPYEAYESIKEAIREFPRFETREFGAAFVAANKKFSKAYPGAEVHITHLCREREDFEVRFELYINNNETYIKEYHIDYSKDLRSRGRERPGFDGGSLEEFFKHLDYLDEEDSRREKLFSEGIDENGLSICEKHFLTCC